MSTEGFFRGHQVARALAIAVPLSVFLIWWGIWGRQGEVETITEVAGEVVQVDGKTCLVRTKTMQTARLLCPKTLRQGMPVRLTQTRFESGELRLALALVQNGPVAGEK
jgi:hypothetical protein